MSSTPTRESGKEREHLDRDEPRYEIKFPLSAAGFQQFILWLKGSSAGIRRTYPSRAVNNIYFDSDEFDNYYDHLAGVANRTKCRLRWYGLTFEPEEIRFELKVKNGTLGYKRVQTLRNTEVDLSSLGSIASECRELLEASFRVELGSSRCPVLFTRYDRDYFSSRDGVRITVDRAVRYCRLVHRQTMPRHLERTNAFAIVEVKYPAASRSNASSMLKDFPYRPMQNSKYVTGLG